MNIASLKVRIGADIRELTQAMSEAQKSVEATSKRMTDMGKTISKKVTAPLVALGGVAVRAFGQQERAELRLRAALQANGREVGNLFNRYNSFAQEMQRVTVVGDEATLAMLAQAESMGLTGDAAEQAVRNSIAMQSAFGVSAERALRYTAALEMGEATMLRRYIPALRGIEDQSEMVAKAQEVLTGAFSAAEAEAQGVTGQLQQMRNALGDALEDIGDIISEAIMPFIERIKELAQQFQELDRQTQKTIVTIGAIVASIGPLLFLIGKTGIAFVALTGHVKALTLAMMTNPWIAAATAVAALVAIITVSNRKLARQRDLVEQALDMKPTGTRDELDKNKQAIANVTDEIERATQMYKQYGMTNSQVARDHIGRLREERQSLFDIRDQIRETITVREDEARAIENQISNIEQSIKATSDETKARKGLSDQIVENRNRIDALIDAKVDLSKIDFEEIANLQSQNDKINKQIELRRRLADIQNITAPEAEIAAVQVDHVSLETANQALMMMPSHLLKTVDAGTNLNETLQHTGDTVKDLSSLSEYMTSVAHTFTDSFGRGMANVVVQGEKLSDVLKNIGRLLASSAIQMGIRMLLTGGTGGGGSITGGLLGRVFSVNDAMITSRGDVVKFHPNDNILAMQDFSGLGGGIDASTLTKALNNLSWVIDGKDIRISNERAGRSFR